MMIIKCDICDCDEGIVRLVGYEIGIDGELFIDALSYCELCWKCKLAIQNTIKDTIKNLLQHQPQLYLEDLSKKKKKARGGSYG
jgi:hypothetical protein